MAGTIKYIPAVLGVLTAILTFTDSIPAPDAGSSICKGRAEFHADSTDCNAYYHCANGRGILKHCQPGLQWNTKANICDWPANVGCEETKSRGETKGGDESDSGEDKPEPPKADPPKSKPPKRKPPSSESGDSSKSSGDDSTSEESVPGSDSSSSESVESKCPKDKKNPKCPAKDPAFSVFFPHSDPHWFYHCSNGVAYCKECPAKLVWNTKCDVCDWEGQNNCPKSSESGDSSKSSGDDSTSEESVPGSDSSSASEEDKPEPPKPEPPKPKPPKPEPPSSESGDSSKSSGDASTSEESVPGSDSSSSESVESKCPIDKKKPKCPAKDPAFSVFFPHSDPHWFYHCSNGVAYCKECPAKLVWNTKCDVCDWEGQNNCPKSSESGDSSKSSGDDGTSEESVPGSDSSSEE